MRTTVPEDRYRAIADAIASDDSPVGIDAKHTHIVILHLLEQLDARLARIEQQLGRRAEHDEEE